jgi:hypothetical protein
MASWNRTALIIATCLACLPGGDLDMRPAEPWRPALPLPLPQQQLRPPPPGPASPDFRGERPSREARELAAWVLASRDHRGLPFAIIDKRRARLMVFDSQARLKGATPVLLGAARGDDSVPGIGNRPIDKILPFERTTPAGRFEARPGRNLEGEDILWVDYDAAVSMHRVRPRVRAERRLERLASPSVKDNRISWGCINVPRTFFDKVVKPASGGPRFIVYVLPETRPWTTMFQASPSVDAWAGRSSPQMTRRLAQVAWTYRSTP